MEKYDTYLFGRTHQMGEQVRAPIWTSASLTFSVLEGFGAHLEAIQANQGLSLIDYFRVSASYDRLAELSSITCGRGPRTSASSRRSTTAA